MSQDTALPGKDGRSVLTLERPLRMLSAWQVQQIDDALADLGPFGEVRLVKNRGRLRFIQKMESTSALEPTSKTVDVSLNP